MVWRLARSVTCSFQVSSELGEYPRGGHSTCELDGLDALRVSISDFGESGGCSRSFGGGAGGAGAGSPCQRPEWELSRFFCLLCTDRRTRVGSVGSDSIAPSETPSIDLNVPYSLVQVQVQVRIRIRTEEDGQRAILSVELCPLRTSSSGRPPSPLCHTLAISPVLITHRTGPVRDRSGLWVIQTKTIK